MALRQKQLNSSINTTGTSKVPEGQPPPPPNKRTLTVYQANFKKKDSIS